MTAQTSADSKTLLKRCLGALIFGLLLFGGYLIVNKHYPTESLTVTYQFHIAYDITNPTSLPATFSLSLQPPLGYQRLTEEHAPTANPLPEDAKQSPHLQTLLHQQTLGPYGKKTGQLSLTGQQQYPTVADTLFTEQPPLLLPTTPAFSVPQVSADPQGMQQLIDWVQRQINYSGYQAKALTLEQLAQTKSGDCTEFALLLLYGVQQNHLDNAFSVQGFYFPDGSSKKLSYNNRHTWLLVQLNDRWWVVDPLYQRVERPSDRYIIARDHQATDNPWILRLENTDSLQLKLR